MNVKIVSRALVIAVSLGVGFLGFPAHSAISRVVDTKVHSELSGGAATLGGCDARIHAGAELFHQGTSQVNASWTSTGELNIGRYAHTATLLPDGKVLVAGGRGSDNCFAPTNSAEIYDPASGTWTLTGSLNTARAGHTATLLQNGLVLVAGGDGDGPLNSAELYDPGTEIWHPTGSFKKIQVLGSSTAPLLTNGKVLVVGRTSASGLEAQVAELYDPETGAWRSTTSPYDAVAHLSLLPNGMVFAVSGWSGFFDYDGGSALYDPAKEEWNFTGEGNYINNPITMTLLRNDKVLVTGVSDLHSEPEQAAIYDPRRKRWGVAGQLPFFVDKTLSGCGCEPWGWRATLLADDQVLVSGILGTALYDATTGTWSPTALPIVPRRDHTATLLPNGTTLIAGGIDDGLVSPPRITSVRVFKKGRPIATIVAGTKAKKLLLEVSGLDFDSSAEILVNGEALKLATASPTRLAGRITEPIVSTPGELSIQVRNSNGRISNTVTVLVVAGQ